MIANFATRAMVCFVAGLSLLALSFTVRAQVDFPARTVTLVNPYPPGGLCQVIESVPKLDGPVK